MGTIKHTSSILSKNILIEPRFERDVSHACSAFGGSYLADENTSTVVLQHHRWNYTAGKLLVPSNKD
eukprot:m.728 g.728  ORF g.728 m.728 type:complete len:67 (-) comp452_c0_seq1:114-314(-)